MRGLALRKLHSIAQGSCYCWSESLVLTPEHGSPVSQNLWLSYGCSVVCDKGRQAELERKTFSFKSSFFQGVWMV